MNNINQDEVVDLTPEAIRVFECADGTKFDTIVEAREYTNNNLSEIIIDETYNHPWKKGDTLYLIEKDEESKDIITVIKVLGNHNIKEWRYYKESGLQHLHKFNRLHTWVINRIPEGDKGFSYMFDSNNISKLKLYNRS